ncbi:MAG: formate dehydrogenase subunit alpha, partial [Betaproteobacteria bacterium]|nr:formate dehydrogenase subunit alpha [Betaproteobacteria bacterium]
MAKGMGLNWHYEGEHHGVAAVYEEMRQAMHEVISGISWDRLVRESSVTYPCLTEDDPGEPTVFKDQFDMSLGVNAGDVITLSSRRGEVCLRVRRDDGTPQGAVFVPFAYYEAAANLLTNAALDPVGKIPEFKYCAIAVKAGGQLSEAVGFFQAPA